MKKQTGFLLLLLLVFLSSCGTSEKKASVATKPTQIFKVGIEAEVSTIDVSQAMNNTDCKVMSQIGEGLYAFDGNGQAVPAVATKVTAPTDDGLVYTFTLRKDAKWSNGDPVTAADFVYSWRRTVTPTTASPQSYYFDGIKNYASIAAGKLEPSELGVKATGKYELQVTLDHPMPYFPQLMAIPAFFPLNEKFVEKQGANYGTTAATTLYNGPFVMADWNGTDTSWKYKKNKNYWDAKNVALKEVDVEVMKEVSTARNLFVDNKLDMIEINGEFVAQEKGNAALKERKLPGTYYIQYNTQQKILSNKKARQAIDLAINSKEIANSLLNDGSKPATGFVPSGFVNTDTGKDFAAEVGKIKKADSKKAASLWKEAKNELGIDEATLTILCSDTDSAKKLSEYLQGTITEKLDGLKINVSAVPFNNRLEKSRSGDFDIVLGGWTPVYADPIDFLTLFDSSNSNNFGKWSNAEYDQRIKEANTTYALDPEKRWTVMMEADKLLSEEVPVTPLYQMSEVYLVNKKVKGVEFGPLGSTYYKGISITK